MALLRSASSKLLTTVANEGPSGLMRRASQMATAAPMGIARRASNAVVAVKDVVMPGHQVGLDVLGLEVDEEESSSTARVRRRGSLFEGDDLFEVEVEDEMGNLSPAIAGTGLTSQVIVEDEDQPLGWYSELLLLTHEPLRRDMLEMQRALQPNYFGEFPEGWRVRAFFRFFTGWSSLVTQQHAVEVGVHYDWLCANSDKISGEQRTELLSYHRSIELELLAISKLEKKILEELRNFDAQDGEPFSEVAVILRDRLSKLTRQIRMHLAVQESKLPEMLKNQWGRLSPPDLVVRALDAAKRAQASGAKTTGQEKVKLLSWIVHYLEKRDPTRSKALLGQLPFFKRVKYAFGYGNAPHARLLEHLRCIIIDSAPKESTTSYSSVRDQGGGNSGAPSSAQDDHEKKARAAMINSVLASANARFADAPVQKGNALIEGLAASETPLHQFKMDGNWVNNKGTQVPDNLYKKIGIEKPSEPRRL